MSLSETLAKTFAKASDLKMNSLQTKAVWSGTFNHRLNTLKSFTAIGDNNRLLQTA